MVDVDAVANRPMIDQWLDLKELSNRPAKAARGTQHHPPREQSRPHIEDSISDHRTLMHGAQQNKDPQRPEAEQQPTFTERVFATLLTGDLIFATGSVMYRREIFELVGGFDPSLIPSADYDLYYRIASRFPIHCHEETIAEYRKHGTSMTRSGELMLRCNLAALRSQWKHVKRSRQKKEAYKTGIRFWKQAWGRYVVEQIRAAMAEGEWMQATQGMLSLLRYSPFCLGSMLNDYPLPRKALDWMWRSPRKSAQAPRREQGSK